MTLFSGNQYSVTFSKKVFTAVRNFLSLSSTCLVRNVRTLVQILRDIKCDNAVEFNDFILELKAQRGENKIQSCFKV